MCVFHSSQFTFMTRNQAAAAEHYSGHQKNLGNNILQ